MAENDRKTDNFEKLAFLISFLVYTVREIVSCKEVNTGILLPFAMSGISCETIGDYIYVCGSQFGGHDKDCTKFDGTKFHDVPSNGTNKISLRAKKKS